MNRLIDVHAGWPGRAAFYKSKRVYFWMKGRAGKSKSKKQIMLGGYARTARNLAYVIIPGAGHKPQLEQPGRTLSMITRFIEGYTFDDDKLLLASKKGKEKAKLLRKRAKVQQEVEPYEKMVAEAEDRIVQ